MKTTSVILSILLLCCAVLGDVYLTISLDESAVTYPPSRDGEVEDTKISSGSALWQSYGYYTIYKTACVALGFTAMGIASSLFIGGIFAEILSGRDHAQREYTRGKIIMWTGIATAYGLSLFAPKIVAHNIRMDDPNSDYDRLLESGLIVEATSNAIGLGMMILGYNIDKDFWTDALVIAGFLFYYVPTPTVMYSTYMNCNSQSPAPTANLNIRACTFSITDLPDGSRDYSFKIDLANAIDYR